MTNDDFDFLKGWEGRIVVCRMYDPWQKEREKFLYNGSITTQNVREIRGHEIVIEFDHVMDTKVGTTEFKEAREEALEVIEKLKKVLIKQKAYFYITDHQGKSPHLIFTVEGLEHYSHQYSSEYKLRMVEDLLKEVKFQSEKLILDRGLILTKFKLISLEHQPHFKSEYKGQTERIIFTNDKGTIPKVKPEIMQEIIDGMNTSLKEDKVISEEQITINDVQIEPLKGLWKGFDVEGKRNASLLAFGGLCRRKGLTLSEADGLLKVLMDHIGKSQFYATASKQLTYSYDRDLKDVAVFFHLKKIISEDKVKEVYQRFSSCFRSKSEAEYIPVRLSQLNASHIHKKVNVNCQITGEQSQKAVVRTKYWECSSCKKQFIEILNPYKSIFPDPKDRYTPEKCCEDMNLKCTRNEYTDHAELYVRDLLVRDEQFKQTRYDSKEIFVVGKELPRTKVINIKGQVIVHPKNKNISIIADDIRPLKNQVEDFQITEDIKLQWKKYFDGSYDLADEINPDIVGTKRKIAKKCIISHLHSPCQIYEIDRKKIIRGNVNVLFFGDTKLGKSEIAKDITTNRGYYELGEYCVVETGGRTGFLYTINNDKGTIIWGSLALNDMGSLVLDGLQKMFTEEMGEFRESLELQEIIVNRSVKGSALARTRIIGCLNPNKSMNEYILKCEAVTDNYVLKNAPDVTRWDLFVPFCQNDVPSSEIAQRVSKDRKIPKEIFVSHIYWVWSRRPDQITITPPACDEIRAEAERLINDYRVENLPIVHNAVRDVITRLSVSKACELHSTDESHENVIVEKDHVVKAVELYEETLEELELKEYKDEQEGKSKISDDDKKKILNSLQSRQIDILKEIKRGSKSSGDIAGSLGVTDKTIKRDYEDLKRFELIQTRTGKGSCLSVKGVQFMRWVTLGDRDIGTKNVPNNSKGTKNVPNSPQTSLNSIQDRDKKCPYVPRKVHTPYQKKDRDIEDEEPEIDVNDEDLVAFVEKKGSYDMNLFAEKYGEDRMNGLIEKGLLYENPRGTLRVLV